MTLLAQGAMVVAAVVIGLAAAPSVAGQIAGGERDVGADLSAAAGAAMRQADDVGRSLGRLVPARAGASGEGDGGDDRHEVAAALEALAAVDGGRSGGANKRNDAGERNDANKHNDANERIDAIEALRDAWSGRYRSAEAEHRRLGYRIEHAERAAGRYFRAQAELTRGVRDPVERSRADAGDRAEMRVYARWRDQAHRTRARAGAIMDRLHDLDVMISKRRLSANFASVRRDLLELPIAVRDLDRDLERLRARWEEMGAALGGN